MANLRFPRLVLLQENLFRKTHSSCLPEIYGVICYFVEVIMFFPLMCLYRESLMPPLAMSQRLKKCHQCSLHFPPLTLCHMCDAEFLGWVFLTIFLSPDQNANIVFLASPWLEAEVKEIRMGHKVLLNFSLS